MAEAVPRDIGRDDLRTLVRRGAQLVEVSPREEFDRIHLSSAHSIPLALISRHTADRLQWDKPVIVYSRDAQCDLSARAAWRLVSMGFLQVYRYVAGKADWLANGLPVEGADAKTQRAGDLADLDIPTCKRGERVGQVKERVRSEGWNTCAVVNDSLVVLGLLRGSDFDHADQTWTAEEAMERDPRSYRLNASLEEVAEYLYHSPDEGVLVTFTDGKLYGFLKRADVENASA